MAAARTETGKGNVQSEVDSRLGSSGITSERKAARKPSGSKQGMERRWSSPPIRDVLGLAMGNSWLYLVVQNVVRGLTDNPTEVVSAATRIGTEF